MNEWIADIALPIAVPNPYSYLVPLDLPLKLGDCVKVPLGLRHVYGVVISLCKRQDYQGNSAKLKAIISRTQLPTLPETTLVFLKRVAEYTMAPLGMVANMALCDPEADIYEPPILTFQLSHKTPSRLTPARQRVMKTVAVMPFLTKRQLMEHADVSTSVIDALVDDNVLTQSIQPALLPPENPPDLSALPPLSPLQKEVAQALQEAVRAKKFQPFLLEGVTGSGKTEVYFEAIAQALQQDQQVLILLPEIALTSEFLTRFVKRFGFEPGVWHSELAAGKKNKLWYRLIGGQERVVVGARSALFLSFARLGLVVVDEEHESAYKQDDLVRYHARDMAVLRAQIEAIPIILASATPSIETRVNAIAGKYRFLTLPERAAGRVMPDIRAIDLRLHPPDPGKFLSPRLIDLARETLMRGEQVMFFLNRRGYAPLTLCRACGHRWQCPDCDAWLVEHRFRQAFVCHYCGHTERKPTRCTACQAEDSLVACGPGVERITEEIAEVFPDSRIMMLSSDLPGGATRLRNDLAKIATHAVDIIIGTQLLAKGHNFPFLTLAALVDADLGLASNDPRAAERCFQLLAQVTGRAGRGEKPGCGILQTHAPNHPVMQALLSGDHERFYQTEIEGRRAASMPPFGRLVSLLFSAKEKSPLEEAARKLAFYAHQLIREGDKKNQEIEILGPAEPPIAFLRGKHRLRILLKTPRQTPIQSFIRGLIQSPAWPRGVVRVDIDVDPMNFL